MFTFLVFAQQLKFNKLIWFLTLRINKFMVILKNYKNKTFNQALKEVEIAYNDTKLLNQETKIKHGTSHSKNTLDDLSI